MDTNPYQSPRAADVEVGYICLNGIAGVKAAKGRIAAVLIIVVVKVVVELFAVFHTVAR